MSDVNKTQVPGDDEHKKIVNPENMLLPDKEIITFLAETKGVAESDILKTFEPNIYLPDLGKVHECLTEAFDIRYEVPATILPHIEKLIHESAAKASPLDDAKTSIKLYFSDKDEFREGVNPDDTLYDKFETFFELLIAKITPRKEGE